MSNPNDELFSALNKLDEFAKISSKEQSPFEEVKELLQALFFSEYRKEKMEKRSQVKKELIASIGIIKTYLPLVEKYRHGTPEEQKLADLVTRIIANYNEAVKKFSEPNEIAAFTIENHPRVAYLRGSAKENGKIDKLFSKRPPPKHPPSKEEIDTLKMKAIRLIESEECFKDSLIESIKDKTLGDMQEIATDGKTVTLMQTWSELPGEVHRIVGAFKREPKHSIPIKDSFKLFLESVQPGHPYPPQRMGWSLSHWLIPSSVIWIDQIPLLKPLLERKKRAAEGLLPNGTLNLRARKLYRCKKSLFDASRLEYLAFHQELAHSIVRASVYKEEKGFHRVINHFFENLAQLAAPFEAFSQSSADLNRIFIEAPFEKIEEIRLSGKFKDLFALYDAERAQHLRHYADTPVLEEPFEAAKKEYLLHLGPLIGDAAALLLKLQLSEKLKAKPPPLSDFELKIQAAAYKHLLDFLDELESQSNMDDPHEREAIRQRMRLEIGSEIELFSLDSFEGIDPFLQELTEETVSYFHARFYAGS